MFVTSFNRDLVAVSLLRGREGKVEFCHFKVLARESQDGRIPIAPKF